VPDAGKDVSWDRVHQGVTVLPIQKKKHGFARPGQVTFTYFFFMVGLIPCLLGSWSPSRHGCYDHGNGSSIPQQATYLPGGAVRLDVYEGWRVSHAQHNSSVMVSPIYPIFSLPKLIG
jgi:hypothetical protein